MQNVTRRSPGPETDPRSPDRGVRGTRWMILVVAALGLTVAYIDRSNLSVSAPFMQKQLGFGDVVEGVILSSFFWTYAIFQLPFGPLLDRFGPRVVYPAAVAWWSIWTAATALANGAGALIGLRLALGAGEAPVQPANIKVVNEWFPLRERAFASSLFDTGQQLGAAVSIPLVTVVIAALGWRAAFLLTGVFGPLWIVLWLLLYRPLRRHFWLSNRERAYIEADKPAPVAADAAPGGAGQWLQLLRFPTTWGLIFGYICRASVVYFFITWYPSYLVDARHFSIVSLGLFGSLPALLAIVADWLGGAFSDYLFRRGLTVNRARKIPILLGMVLAASIAITPLVHNNTVVMVLLCLSDAASAFAAGAVLSLPSDIAPNPGTVGSLASLQNFGSQIGGIISPILVGVLLAIGGGSYAGPLVFAGAMALAGALIYGFVVRVRPLPIGRLDA